MFIEVNASNFTPVHSLFGGVLIGLAACMLIAFKGRIMGICGILASAVLSKTSFKRERAWRCVFILGLLIASTLWAWVFAPLVPEISKSYAALVLAGLMVGFGTRLGSGCTSGHAVCGLARLSKRSFVATLSFMGSGFLTAFLVNHLL
jgi:uncharacterized membrane protein YedE/YeeE